MLSFIARRLGLLIPTFFGVTLLTFALIRLIPGDPVEVMMGERRVDPQMHAEALHRLGLDKPLYQQYLDYVGNLAQGNLGESLTTREGVWHEFLTLFPATLAENIARLEINPDPEKVVAAAQAAGVHEMITGLPEGYSTEIGPGKLLLSGFWGWSRHFNYVGDILIALS